jgi:hypothetical protein
MYEMLRYGTFASHALREGALGGGGRRLCYAMGLSECQRARAKGATVIGLVRGRAKPHDECQSLSLSLSLSLAVLHVLQDQTIACPHAGIRHLNNNPCHHCYYSSNG